MPQLGLLKRLGNENLHIGHSCLVRHPLGKMAGYWSSHPSTRISSSHSGPRNKPSFFAKYTHAMRGACCLTFLNDNVRPGEIASF